MSYHVKRGLDDRTFRIFIQARLINHAEEIIFEG